MLSLIRYFSKTSLLLLIISCSITRNGYSQGGSVVLQWKTWIPDYAVHIKLSSPPGKVQTQKELAEIKQKLAAADEKTIQQIQYWNAGPPSYRWNEIASQMISMHNFNTFARMPMAWMNMAIYDATVAAWKAKYNYNRKRPHESDASIKPLINPPATPSYPCEHAVTAAAAAHVLAYFFPEKADSLLKLAKQAGLSRINAGVQFSSDVNDGWKLGEEVAARIIAEAKKDGSDKQWQGTMHDDPKLWRGPYPVGITVAEFKPLVLKSANQFRPASPPDFANDMKALKDLKRTPETDGLALLWNSLTGLEYWTEQASKKIFEYNLEDDAPECARIYTLLHVTMHDAAIAIMDAKYAYWGIRPFQYDPTYEPLFETPPFPGYPSGHATASSAAANVLAYFFPADAEFFRGKAKECADSRFYGGIHFQTDNLVGLELGSKLAEFVIETKAKNGYAKN